jgi:plasmid stability protein
VGNPTPGSYAGVAQRIEHSASTRMVVSSNLTLRTYMVAVVQWKGHEIVTLETRVRFPSVAPLLYSKCMRNSELTDKILHYSEGRSASMSTVTIRNLPADYIQAYKDMASAHDRSYEAQLRHVLRRVIDDGLVRDELQPLALTRGCLCDYIKLLYMELKESNIPEEQQSHMFDNRVWKMPYNGQLWRAIYSMEYNDTGSALPLALKDGDSLLGGKVEIINPQSSTLYDGNIGALVARCEGYVHQVNILASKIPFDLPRYLEDKKLITMK